MKKYTIKDFDKDFPDDLACLEWLKNARWPSGIHCVKCQCITKHHKISGRQAYACDSCGNHVYPMAGTILEHSSTPLRLWFHAMYLMGSTRCGISAKTLERELGVTYKTAWRMFKQIRTMLSEDTMTLLKEVEIDETYIGGRRHGKTGRGAAGKTPVIGMVERKGNIIATVVSDVKKTTVMPLVNKQVVPLTTVYTDDYSLYDALPYVYPHQRVNHAKKEYVVGKVHTNTIESFWSLAKRGIDGTNHAVSPKYLQGYINAYGFRWNHRNEDEPMFLQILSKLPSLKVA